MGVPSLKCALAALLIGTTLQAQSSRGINGANTGAPIPKAATIEGAAAEYVRWALYASKPHAYDLDPRRVVIARSGSPTGSHHYLANGSDVVYLDTLAGPPLGAIGRPGFLELPPLPRLVACMADPAAAGCYVDGHYYAMSFAVPMVQGSRATLEAILFSATAPDPRGRITPASAGGLFRNWCRFTLSREGEVWKVIAFEMPNQ